MIASKINTPKPQYQSRGVNPKYFTVWLIILGSAMLFAGFTSAYIVHRSDALPNNDWFQFELPTSFLYSSAIALLGSVFMFLAWRSAKNDELVWLKRFLTLTIITGMFFLFTQVLGFQDLLKNHYAFSNDIEGGVSISFVWVIAGFHFLHIFVALGLLVYTLFRSFALKVHKKNMVLINSTSLFWHFVGILWIYLFLFLYFAR